MCRMNLTLRRLLTITFVWLSACRMSAPHSDASPATWAQPPQTELATEPSDADNIAALTKAGVRYRLAPVAATATKQGITCHVPDGVRVFRGSTGIRYPKALHVNAGFALRMVAFETIVQETAQTWLKQPVKKIEHLGTYVCRRVAGTAGTLSEHALGNAIDVSGFVLKNGSRINVKRHYVKMGFNPRSPEEQFLRALVTRLRSERTFSVMLTPDWDKRHHNHLHLDGSRRFFRSSFWRLFS